ELADAFSAAVTKPASPPVAVRAFLVESTHLSRLALVYVALAGLAVPLLALRFVPATEHAPRLLAAGCIAWLLMLPVGVLLARAAGTLPLQDRGMGRASRAHAHRGRGCGATLARDGDRRARGR